MVYQIDHSQVGKHYGQFLLSKRKMTVTLMKAQAKFESTLLSFVYVVPDIVLDILFSYSFMSITFKSVCQPQLEL